jgi:hypothetical protein
MDWTLLNARVPLVSQLIEAVLPHHLFMEHLAFLRDGLMPTLPIWPQLGVSLNTLLDLSFVPLNARVHLLQGLGDSILGVPIILQLQLPLLLLDVSLLLGLRVILSESYRISGQHLSVTALLFWGHIFDCIVALLFN